MLKKSASGVLASLRGSTYRSVRLAFSLAAALLDGHFEHPATVTPSALFDKITTVTHTYTEFFSSLLKMMCSDGQAEHRSSYHRDREGNHSCLFL
jgi:hypothetical protein